jgi:hypothetical protein
VLTHQVGIGKHLLLGIPEELKGPDLSVWVAVLLIQSVPYAAALAMSFISVLPVSSRWFGTAMTGEGQEAWSVGSRPER